MKLQKIFFLGLTVALAPVSVWSAAPLILHGSTSTNTTTTNVAANPSVTLGVLLSGPAQEVVRMSSSGVTADVLTAFVSDAVTTFNLTSENVIYLQRIGLPAQVVTAMLVHDKELKDNAALQQLQQQQQAAPAEMPPTNQPPDMGQETPPYSNDNYYPSGYGYGWFPFLNSDFGFGSGFGSGFGFGDFNHRFNDRFEDRFNHRFNDRFDDRFANRFNRRFNDRFNHRFNDRFDDRFSQTFFPNNFNNFNGFNRFDGFNRFNGFNGIAPNRLFLNGRNFAQPSTAESLTFDPRFPNFRAGARLPNSNFAFRSGRFPHTFFPNNFNNFNGFNDFNSFNGFNRFDGFNRFNGIAPNRLFLNGRNFAQPSTAESLTFDPRFPNFRAGARLPNSNFAFRSGRFPHTFFPNSTAPFSPAVGPRFNRFPNQFRGQFAGQQFHGSQRMIGNSPARNFTHPNGSQFRPAAGHSMGGRPMGGGVAMRGGGMSRGMGGGGGHGGGMGGGGHGGGMGGGGHGGGMGGGGHGGGGRG